MTDRSKIDDLWCRARQRRKQSNERMGQALFNALCEMDGLLAQSIAEYKYFTDFPQRSVDCFYDDKKIPEFIAYVKAVWHNDNEVDSD